MHNKSIIILLLYQLTNLENSIISPTRALKDINQPTLHLAPLYFSTLIQFAQLSGA